MDFSCAVCKRSFSRPQDRLSHLILTHDSKHQAHLRQENQMAGRRFREAAASAKKARSRRNLVKTHDISKLRAFPMPSFSMDMESQYQTTFPEEKMDVDYEKHDIELLQVDEEDSIIVTEGNNLEVQEHPEDVELLDLTAQGLFGVETEDPDTGFDFLPVQRELASGGDPEPVQDPSVYRPMHHTLVEDDDQLWDWHWHPTAGQVFGKKLTVHEQWSKLFSGKEAETSQSYEPFASRLEWEVAQWAVQEKVSQKSFDRLLRIPQVCWISLYCNTTVLISNCFS